MAYQDKYGQWQFAPGEDRDVAMAAQPGNLGLAAAAGAVSGAGGSAEGNYYAQRAEYESRKQQMEMQRIAEMKKQGLNPDGSPVRPEWQTNLDPDGNIKYQYKMDVAALDPTQMEGFSKYKSEAMRSGPSAWANMQLQQQQQEAQNQKSQAAVQAMTGNSQAQSQLAMRGGLGGGARTSLARSSQRDLLNARQGVGRQASINRLSTLAGDEQNRIQQLGNLASAETDLGKYNKTFEAQQRKQNIENALRETEGKRAADANVYKEQMAKWAADKQADATASSGGGGK